MANQSRRDAALLDTIQRAVGTNSRPLLLTGGTVISMNPTMGDWERADVLIVGSVIAGVGPGLINSAEDDKSIVIDCDGMVVLPAHLDYTSPEQTGSLTPGSAADIVVITLKNPVTSGVSAESAQSSHLDIRIIGGTIQVWDGDPLNQADVQPESKAMQGRPADNQSRFGMWVDENDFLKQELLPNGRYDEARAERKSAFQGQYWINGDRIDYLDDLGFWAFGEFKNGVLNHAGYILTKRK